MIKLLKVSLPLTALLLTLGTPPSLASATFVTPASGSKWGTSATSTTNWTEQTSGAFRGMRFSVASAGAPTVIDVVVSGTGVGFPSDLTGYLCGFPTVFSPGSSEVVGMTTGAVTTGSVTCRITTLFPPGVSRFIEIGVRPVAASGAWVTYGSVTVQLAGPVPNDDNNNNQRGSQNPIPVTPAAPIKYSGPEFSELSLKPALAGSSATLEGRKLDQISSVTIGGKAAVLSNATDKSVNIGLPAGLTPGVYDLVVTTASHGKLTHMNAIRIREELPATSLTIQGTGVLSGEEFKKLTAFARTQNPDMNTVTCIVNSGSEGKSFTQVRALCDRIAAANPNIKTTQFEVRSTVKSSAVFARVVFSSEQ